jgi:hypothetical protein
MIDAHVFNRGVYLLWGLIGFRGSPEIPMEMNDVVAGLAGLVLTYALARRIGMSFQLGLVCVVAVASSYGYWWYSVEGETYLLPIPFILLSAYQFIAIAEGRFESKRFVGLGLTLAVATLFHQQHILLVLLMPLCKSPSIASPGQGPATCRARRDGMLWGTIEVEGSVGKRLLGPRMGGLQTTLQPPKRRSRIVG